MPEFLTLLPPDQARDEAIRLLGEVKRKADPAAEKMVARKAATVLYRSLSAAKEEYEKGERDAEKLRRKMKEVIASEPLAQMQYVSCADYDTLQELEKVKGKTLLSMAVYFRKTRLIDNFVLI